MHDRLPGMDDFARFGSDRRDRAWRIGVQGRIAQLTFGELYLRLGEIDLGLGGLERILCIIELRTGHPPAFKELLLP